MEYDVIIIGSGPAGYVAAIRAGQVGLKTAIIEKSFIGGMCLNWGCIPSKAIIESAKYYDRLRMADEFGVEGINQKKLSFNWEKAKNRALDIAKKLTEGVVYLLKKNGVDIIRGEAKITSKNSVTVDNRAIDAKNIIIATGSYPNELEFDIPKDNLLEMEHLYDEKELPSSVVIVGMGGVAVEMAQFFKMIGKEVTLVTPTKSLLPIADKYLDNYIFDKLQKDGVNILVEKNIKEYKNGKLYAGEHEIKCEKVLNASMRGAVLPPSDIDIALDYGYIKTDENLKTTYENIYAVGDVNGKSFLAHVGSAQGLYVINKIKGIKGAIDLHNYPINIYTNPEMAQIGLTEQELQSENIPYKVSEFPLSANGKALIEGYEDGSVRMLSEKRYGEVLGVQIIAPHATDMIAEAAAFMQIEGTVYDVAKLIHAHPTISEVFMEAGFDAVDKAIHK